MAVAVVDRLGSPLMPTTERKARILLKKGRAVIHKYRPMFTIRLTDREGGTTQPLEYKCDTGYQHIGISICTEKHEYVNAQYDMLPDEVERHNDCRKYRRRRRSRIRYRKPRFSNRKGKMAEDGYAPSIRNRRDCHIRLFTGFLSILPVTSAVFEMGQFDIQVLKAIEEGKPVPEGAGYQKGERYGYDTLREAVFARDGYRCIICGRKGIPLRGHHRGFWRGDRTSRMANLSAVCICCHIPGNHKPGGILWGLEPETKDFKGATFMTMVRWDMLGRLKEAYPDIPITVTYGAATKRARKDLGLKKTHSNDAYSMGSFHPEHRTDLKHYRKKRRNNRILERFYDAGYLDIRDGKKKSGAVLSCGRTRRAEPRHGEKDLRPFRGKKISKGRRSVRTRRYPLQPKDTVLYECQRQTVKGTHCRGTRVMLENGISVSIKKLEVLHHASGWVPA